MAIKLSASKTHFMQGFFATVFFSLFLGMRGDRILSQTPPLLNPIPPRQTTIRRVFIAIASSSRRRVFIAIASSLTQNGQEDRAMHILDRDRQITENLRRSGSWGRFN